MYCYLECDESHDSYRAMLLRHHQQSGSTAILIPTGLLPSRSGDDHIAEITKPRTWPEILRALARKGEKGSEDEILPLVAVDGLLMSSLGRGMMTASKRNFYHPLTAVYGQWCTKLIRQGIRRTWPRVFQCTWSQHGEAERVASRLAVVRGRILSANC
jgi:hypothetical protein